MKDHLMVALDVADGEMARAMRDAIGTQVGWLKIGMRLFVREGPALVREIQKTHRVFLDLKFHDIPNTVAAAVKAAGDLGVWMINMHAAGGRRAMEAALEANGRHGETKPLLIAVTVLTSLGPTDLTGGRLPKAPGECAVHLAKEAWKAGLDGAVCSPYEAGVVKEETSQDFLAVTPGIRPAGSDRQDQRRCATPEEAIALGSDYLVIGRAVTGAEDPVQALHRITGESTKGGNE